MLTDIPQNLNYNLGGLLNFSFVPAGNIEAFPMIFNGVINTPVSLLAGASWLKGYATHESTKYTEDVKETEQGDYYEPTFTGFIPGDSLNLHQVIANMEQVKKFVLQLRTSGGLRLLGNPALPMEFSASFSTGAKRSDEKGYNFKFSGKSLYRAPIYAP